MRRLMTITLGCVLLAGCSSAQKTVPASVPVKPAAITADSALENCTSPNAARPKPVTGGIAADFASDRVTKPISLDGGTFQAIPASAQSDIPAALALCNELSAATAQNFMMSDEARQTGFSLGLGLVTISLPTGDGFGFDAGASGQPPVPKPARYHARLAWIGVGAPITVSSCPAETAAPTPVPTVDRLPGYQIVVIDAETGADGVLYSASADLNCTTGTSKPAAQPALQFASAPWSLVKRLPDGHSADITYRRRSCDSTISGLLDGKPGVTTDQTHSGLVDVEIQRAFARCGAPASDPLYLRGPLPSSLLPTRLIHAPVGAENIPDGE